MAHTNDGTLYSYASVIPLRVPSQDGTLYTYSNIGLFRAASLVGRVRGFATPMLAQLLYTYAYILEYISGAPRLMEDGTDRLMEDGTDRQVE